MVGSDDEKKWWTRAGIKARWDEERGTGPPKTIVVKFVREAGFPVIVAILSAGVIAGASMEANLPVGQSISLVLGTFSGVFYFLYKEAGFKDATLRGD